jgi:hypothetical protein
MDLVTTLGELRYSVNYMLGERVWILLKGVIYAANSMKTLMSALPNKDVSHAMIRAVALKPAF